MKRINTIALVNTAYKDNPIFEEIDTAYVPWENNSMEEAFANCVNLATVSRLNNNVSNMVNAFANCSSLVNVSIPSSVVNMVNTFADCSSLENISILSDNLNDMSDAFKNCNNLQNVSITSNSITNMDYVFDNCPSITNVSIISNSINSMHGTFKNCESLNNVSNIPNSVRDLSFSFCNCYSLINAPVFEENSNVMTLEGSFKGSGIYLGPNLTNCDNLIDMRETFFGCQNISGIPLIPNSVANLSYTFAWCDNFLGKSDEIYIEEKNYYGYNCIEVNENVEEENSPILSFSLDEVLDIGSILYFTEFYGDESDDYKIDYEYDEDYSKYYIVRKYEDEENVYGIAEESKITNFETFEVENEEDIVKYNVESNSDYNFKYIISTPISTDRALDIPNNVTNMSYTFARCSYLEDLPNFSNATSVVNLSGCFRECNSLTGTPNFSNCNEISDMEETFYNCSEIIDGIEKEFYGWEEINEGTYFATNNEGIDNGDDLYNVEKVTIGEDLYAYIYTYEEEVEVDGDTEIITHEKTYYLKNEIAEIDDRIYEYIDDILTECDTVKSVTTDIGGETVIEFNNEEISATRYSNYDIRKTYEYNIDIYNTMRIIDVIYDMETENYSIKYVKDNDESEYEIIVRRFNDIDTNKTVYGQIVLPNHVINMKETFYGCNIVKTPIIPNSVTNMSHTFAYCNNLEGDIYINSAVIENTTNCFVGTTLTKNVYIPFRYQNGVNTQTYESFLAANYSSSVRKDGALLINVDTDDIDLTDYNYNMDELTRDVELYNYANTIKENINTPNVTPQG